MPSQTDGWDGAAVEAAQANRGTHRLGVLLVHGIGTQPPGDTLIRWGDVLVQTIGRATRGRVDATIEHAVSSGAVPDQHGARATVRLCAGSHEERWLLSEGLWADAFAAPSYRQLVSWSLRALPWAIAFFILQRHWSAAQRGGRAGKVVAAAASFVRLSVALAIAPLLIGLLGVGLLLGLIPIPRLRAAILDAQRTLTATVGDSLAFVESPVRAALIRTRINDQLRRLKQQCDHTVVVAHSQGAAVVLDALGGIPDRPGQPELPAVPAVPEALVTFGAGTNQLANLKALSGWLLAKLKTDPVWYLVVGLFGVGGLAAWLWWQVSAGRISGKDLLLAGGLYLLVLAGGGLIIWLGFSLTTVLRRRWQFVQKHGNDIAVWGSTAVFFTGLGALIIYADRTDLPLLPVIFLALAASIWLSAGMNLLSKDVQTLLTTVHTPRGLARWVDLYASADPVPNGATRTATGAGPESFGIANEGSFFADHSAYWDNLDGFVLRVIRVCADTAASPWRTELAPELPVLDQRAEWRVTWLRMARYNIALIWLFIGTIGFALPPGDVLPESLTTLLPDWIPSPATTPMRLLMLIALVVVGTWASYHVVRLVWRRWVREEQYAVLDHRSPGVGTSMYLGVMGAVVWILLVLGIQAARGGLSDLPRDPGEILLMLLAFGGVAWFSSVVLLQLHPPPRMAAQPVERSPSGRAGTSG